MNPEVFQLSLEQQLNFETFKREIENCNDIEKLREIAITVIQQNMIKNNVVKDMCKHVL